MEMRARDEDHVINISREGSLEVLKKREFCKTQITG